MTDHFTSKFITDQRDRMRMALAAGKGGPLSNPYLSDAEYVELYRQYILSLEAYIKAIQEACAIFMKAHLPGPRREIDFYKIESLRRFYETDAYKYFTYRPHIKSPLPPMTRMRVARGYMKDGSFAQLLGNYERAEEKMKQAQDEVTAIVSETWRRYKETPEPKSDAVKRELLNALALAQVSLLEIPLMGEIQGEVNRVLPSQSKSGR
jgi:citrate synthase